MEGPTLCQRDHDVTDMPDERRLHRYDGIQGAVNENVAVIQIHWRKSSMRLDARDSNEGKPPY